MSRHDVVTRLTESLDDAATGYDPDIPPFDPHRPPSVVLPEEAAAGRLRSRLWLVAAAALVVVVAITSLAVLRSDDDPDGSVRTGGEVEVPDPPGAEAPTWLPDGLVPWSVTWHRESVVEQGAALYQLFGNPDSGPAVLLIHQSADNAGTIGESVTVRGRPALLMTSVDDEGTVEWTERGALVQARWRGMPTAEALVALESLLPTSSLRDEGFVPPVGPLAETGRARKPDEEQVTKVVAVYAGAQPDGLRVTVETTSGTSEQHWTYLRDRFFDAGADPDGVVRARPAGQPGATVVTWPDGRAATITVTGGELGDDDVVRIADSVAPIGTPALARLGDDALARAVEAPLVAAADLPAARVEVRGQGNFHLLCLVPAGGGHRCQAPNSGMDAEQRLLEGFVVDGVWLAVAATRLPTRPLWIFDPASMGVETQDATDGGWSLSLVPVADGSDDIAADLGVANTSFGLSRPGA